MHHYTCIDHGYFAAIKDIFVKQSTWFCQDLIFFVQLYFIVWSIILHWSIYVDYDVNTVLHV